MRKLRQSPKSTCQPLAIIGAMRKRYAKDTPKTLPTPSSPPFAQRGASDQTSRLPSGTRTLPMYVHGWLHIGQTKRPSNRTSVCAQNDWMWPRRPVCGLLQGLRDRRAARAVQKRHQNRAASARPSACPRSTNAGANIMASIKTRHCDECKFQPIRARKDNT